MNLDQLAHLFSKAGATKLYAKMLSENDNSKNQIYFAGAVEALNVFPSTKIFAENTSNGPSFKASLDFGWLLETGLISPAPHAQLILYSQYPEVRFSGFLKGCKDGPNALMLDRGRTKILSAELQKQMQGRVLFLATTADKRVLGYVAPGGSAIAREFQKKPLPLAFVVFSEVPLPNIPDEEDSKNRLLSELRRIHKLGWIDSKQLDSSGFLKPCCAPQCGGFTLEAELGIPKNSGAAPDFLGWEIKQHSVANFERSNSGAAITLMTPEPTGGFYNTEGVEAFVRKFGYPDKNDIPDRLNFGGIHRTGHRQPTTGLKMELVGFDEKKGKITDAQGAIVLVNDNGEVAAEWAFSGLLAHWSRKHRQAAYVPSIRSTNPNWRYAYGKLVRLAQGTDSLKLLAALASGAVYYDPGIKLENISTKPTNKRRSQFRIASRNISVLYNSVESVVL